MIPRPIPPYAVAPEACERGRWRKLSRYCREILEGLEDRPEPPDDEAMQAMAHLFHALLRPHLRRLN